MLSSRFARLGVGMLAASTLFPLSACAYARNVTAETPPPPVIELACADSASDALTGDAKRYSLPDSDGTLWLVPCIRGAYQTAYNVVVAPQDGHARRLLFAQWRDESWTGTADVFDPAFDMQSGVLTDRYKDRGVGDCGGARRWQWNGYDFRLLEYRAKSDCDGTNTAFPVIFEAPALP